MPEVGGVYFWGFVGWGGSCVGGYFGGVFAYGVGFNLGQAFFLLFMALLALYGAFFSFFSGGAFHLWGFILWLFLPSGVFFFWAWTCFFYSWRCSKCTGHNFA
ncbi:hypothetical protein PUR28_18430, partial [Streptomyces sp. BE308]|uniref:hypothetical protein n=1 Tax=Streptomyces sp. BE308 TaxID=3002529 RepID=UPI002E7A5484